MDLHTLKGWGEGRLPGLLGMGVEEARQGYVRLRMPLGESLLAPNGFLHGGSVVALADTACGYGTMASLPPGGKAFTTLELKANFLGTTRSGAVFCEATMAHGGRTTQIWDAKVLDEGSGKTLALFRCTQLILYETPPLQRVGPST